MPLQFEARRPYVTNPLQIKKVFGMNLNKHILAIVCLAVMICGTGCAGRNGGVSVSMDKVVFKPEYASGFEILGSDSARSVIIRSFNPWQGTDSVVTELLVRRGEEPVPEGFSGQVVDGDAKRIVAMSSTHIAMLDAVGRVSTIVGASGLGYVSNRYIQSHNDSVADIGFDGGVDYELLVSLRPDIVLLYGVNGASTMEGKLKEFGIPFMYVGDYVEESPVGKAEWLVALAELSGVRQAGIERIGEIAARYDSLKAIVAGNIVKDPPRVMVNTPYADQWFMPSVSNYTIRLINDAGGEFVYDKNNGNTSVPVDIEEAFILASMADVWINTGTAVSMDEIKRDCPRFMNTNCVRNGQVYNNNLRSTPAGGNDMFESGTVRPDLVLRDLIKIFNPRLLPDSVPFVYYHKLE